MKNGAHKIGNNKKEEFDAFFEIQIHEPGKLVSVHELKGGQSGTRIYYKYSLIVRLEKRVDYISGSKCNRAVIVARTSGLSREREIYVHELSQQMNADDF